MSGVLRAVVERFKHQSENFRHRKKNPATKKSGGMNLLLVNPCMVNGLAHCYHLGESTVIFRSIRSDFGVLFLFLMKLNSPRWDAAFCGVVSWAILFGHIP